MKRRLAFLAAVLALAAPAAAEAHLTVSGLGPVYDGVSHFALSPEDSLPVVALALFAGLRGPFHARVVLAALPLAWMVGGLAVMATHANLPPVALSAMTAGLLLLIGGALALDVELSPRLTLLPTVALGLLRGVADLSGVPLSGSATLALIGMAASVFVVMALAASLTLPLRKFWMIIAARVTGSWLAAVGLLLAGWIIRYGARVP